MMQSIFFLPFDPLPLLLPLILLPLQSLLQTSIIEIVLLLLILIPFGPVIHIMILIEPLLIYLTFKVLSTAIDD